MSPQLLLGQTLLGGGLTWRVSALGAGEGSYATETNRCCASAWLPNSVWSLRASAWKALSLLAQGAAFLCPAPSLGPSPRQEQQQAAM